MQEREHIKIENAYIYMVFIYSKKRRPPHLLGDGSGLWLISRWNYFQSTAYYILIVYTLAIYSTLSVSEWV